MYSSYFVNGEKGLLSEMEEMKKNGTWGTGLELYAASEMLLFNFEAFYASNMTTYCSCLHFPEHPTIYLEFENGNHFNSLFPEEGKSKFFNRGEKQNKQFLKQ